MKKTIYTLSALALAFSMGAQANTTGEVEVSGTISPTACTLQTTSNTINAPQVFLNAIQSGDNVSLERGNVEAIQENILSFSINCAALTAYDLRLRGLPIANRVGIGYFAGGDLSAVSNAGDAIEHGFYAFPLTNVTNDIQEAGWVHLVSEALGNDRTVTQRMENGNLNGFASQGTRFGLINAENKWSNVVNRRLVIDDHQPGVADNFVITAYWTFDGQNLSQTETNFLQGSIDLEVVYQ